MNLGFLTKNLRISKKRLAATILLNSGTLAWFFLLILYLPEIFSSVTLTASVEGYYFGQVLFIGSVIFWSITGSFIGSRFDRRKLLVSSIFIGTFSTILIPFMQGTISVVVVSLLLGLSAGLGMPSSMAIVADYTAVEERGRVSGVTILGTFILAFVSMAIIRVLSLGILGIVLLFAAVRSTSLVALAIDKCDRSTPLVQVANVKTHLPPTVYREFFFYVFPWLMFSIASSLAWNIIPQQTYAAELSTGATLRYVFIAIFGLVSGIMADKFGRKRPIIIGLIILGLAFAMLGFNLNQTSVIVYLAISGVTWGAFFVVFLAVPGDLSAPGSREKFYALGYVLPLAGMFSLIAVPTPDYSGFLPTSSFSQILSIILFLSIIPVLRAKETLQESKIQERKLKEHVERVGKIIKESEDSDQEPTS